MGIRQITIASLWLAASCGFEPGGSVLPSDASGMNVHDGALFVEDASVTPIDAMDLDSCEGLAADSDEFDVSISASRWTILRNNSVAVTPKAGRIDVDLVSSNEWSRGGVRLNAPINLIGKRINFLVHKLPKDNPGINTRLFLISNEDDNDSFFGLIAAEGELKFYYSPDRANWELQDSIEYNDELHRYWQLREEGGVVYAETSPDGLGWGAFSSLSANSEQLEILENGELSLYAVTLSQVSNPGTMVFDKFNGGDLCLDN